MKSSSLSYVWEPLAELANSNYCVSFSQIVYFEIDELVATVYDLDG